MARHRAPSSQSVLLSTVAVTGATLGAAVLAPWPAAAADLTGHSDGGTQHGHHHGHHGSAGNDRDGRRAGQHHQHLSQHLSQHRSGSTHPLRPPTSGEEQYRNGCRQGYIADDCEAFTVPSLLHRGINPYL